MYTMEPAEAAATLDQTSQRRVRLGGAGGHPSDWRKVGSSCMAPVYIGNRYTVKR